MPYFHAMKIFLAFFCAIVSISLAAQEHNHNPELLKEPAGWEFERFSLPPSFAPGITYKGAEELRFAPGMFKKDSAAYFTYAFVVQLDNIITVSQNDFSIHLLLFFFLLVQKEFPIVIGIFDKKDPENDNTARFLRRRRMIKLLYYCDLSDMNSTPLLLHRRLLKLN